MSEIKSLTKKVQSAIKMELEKIGFKKRGFIFASSLNKDTLGLVGLNRATYFSENSIGINPVMGVSNTKVRKLLDSLMGWEPSEYNIAVVISPLGYLMTENTFKEWYFNIDESIDQILADLMTTMIKYGIPWIEKQKDWRVLAEVAMTAGLPGYREYIPPIIWLAYDDKRAALAYCEEILDKKKYYKEPILDYSKFVEKIRYY